MSRNSATLDQVTKDIADYKPGTNDGLSKITQEIADLRRADPRHFQENLHKLSENDNLVKLGFPAGYELIGMEGGKLLAANGSEKGNGEIVKLDARTGKAETPVTQKLTEQEIGGRGRKYQVDEAGGAYYRVGDKGAENVWNIARDYATGKGVSPLLVKMQAQAMSQGSINFDELLVRIREHIDADRVKNALKMLKAESFRLYTDLTDDSLVGVVKSQTDPDLVYSCRLTSGGIYSCCTQNLNTCGGLRNGACKHLLVLLIGLTKSGELSPTTADLWMQASFRQKPQLDKEMMTTTFLRFKGAEAGEIDWRPTETIPEDYYSM